MAAKKNKPLQKSTDTFPVVGVGASAGGLDAFKKFIKAIPENSGMAFALVQHLDPTHESLLPEILQKVTKIPVLEILDDMKIEPNYIYIIPQNKILIANDNTLQLSPRSEKNKLERHLPIDLFFSSLAEVHQGNAVGVILSGTGSDGVEGLKAIKNYGGVTFAQSTDSAAYSGMPESAVQAGVADFVLPPEKMPGKILEVVKQITNGGDELSLSQQEDKIYRQILSLLRIRKNTDFTYYKQTTIHRRILRRMVINKTETLTDYLNYLRENKTEQDVLYQDFLIPVTSFFRDSKSFDNLCESIFPQIIKDKTAPVRVWVAGCSTGEEAYSIAICCKEFLNSLSKTLSGKENLRVQIFATDISEPAIAKARTGIYKKSEVAGVTAERLKEFFIKTDGGYQLNKQLRDMCIFAVHNFLKDPPFAKMDLISCRNVLIYMEPYLQKKALTVFHYALNQKGFLLLGKSETVSIVPDLFVSLDPHEKLFFRKDAPGAYLHTPQQRMETSIDKKISADQKSENKITDFQKAADDILLSKFTPPGVVVNEAMDIVHFRGGTGPYLEPSPGKPNYNLLKMAKSGLAFELRNILHKAKKEKAPVTRDNVPVQTNGQQRNISIEAIPLQNMADPHYLILFHDKQVAGNAQSSSAKKIKTSGKAQKDDKEARIRQLENELAQVREDMRGITEEQEAANEELQSANEELLSSSEELQSLNEELETSKEELQSTNEELTVVNQELISLNEQVTEARDYAEAIVTTVREPLVVLDAALRVKTANAAFYKTFGVNEMETENNLIYHLGNNQLDIPALRKLLEKIIPEKTKFSGFEVKYNIPHAGVRTMLLNACEIIRRNGAGKLMLLAIEDITERKMAEAKIGAYMKAEAAAKDKLEETVQERTKELQEANIDLNYLNNSLEQFAFAASHDLQEPLRKIQTFAQRLQSRSTDNLSDVAKHDLERISAASGRMRTLIDDLLEYSRLSFNQQSFEKTNLHDIIKGVLSDFDLLITEKKARINYANHLPVIDAIPIQMKQLFSNIIGNALKFSKREMPGVITISSSKLTKAQRDKHPDLKKGNGYFEIIISDNGIGFNQEYGEKIFELFQRLNGISEYGGTGIGLAICRKIVLNHEGEIYAVAKENKGASFHIILPEN